METRILNFTRIERAIDSIQQHYGPLPDLREMTQAVDRSPFHFQKMFVDCVVISLKKFLQYFSWSFLKEKIRATQNMIEVAEEGNEQERRAYQNYLNAHP